MSTEIREMTGRTPFEGGERQDVTETALRTTLREARRSSSTGQAFVFQRIPVSLLMRDARAVDARWQERYCTRHDG